MIGTAESVAEIGADIVVVDTSEVEGSYAKMVYTALSSGVVEGKAEDSGWGDKLEGIGVSSVAEGEGGSSVERPLSVS